MKVWVFNDRTFNIQENEMDFVGWGDFLPPLPPYTNTFKWLNYRCFVMSVWMEEWKRFTPTAIEDMKRYSDDTNEHREWMSYVYDVGGKYELGKASYGGLSKIEVSPEKKEREDLKKPGFKGAKRKWTIHGHPLKDGKIYTGRQYFSSTDICREYVRCRDNDEYVAQFLVYPHKQKDTTTGKEVMHNRCRVLVFPNRETVVRAMRDSNPNTDAMAITPQSGQNQSVKMEDGSTTLRNESGVDWFAFQEALGRLGFMGIVDIEGPSQGARQFHSESLREGKTLAGMAIVGLFGWYVVSRVFKVPTFMNAESVQVVEGFGAECSGFHN